MTGSIEESDLAPVKLDIIGADMLGNPARFASNNVCFANSIQKGGLAVIDVTHDSDNRRPLFQSFRCIRG